MSNIQKKIFRILLVFFGLLFLSIISAYFFRNLILSEIIAKVEHKFKTDYNADFSIKKSNFIGISEVEMSQILLVPKNADTLLSIDNIKTKINIYKIITGDLQIENLELKNGFIQLVKNKNGKNFAEFLKSDKKEIVETTEKKDYAEFANRIISKILNLVPENISIENITFKLDDLGKKVSLKAPKLTLKNDELQTSSSMAQPSTLSNILSFQKSNSVGCLADMNTSKLLYKL